MSSLHHDGLGVGLRGRPPGAELMSIPDVGRRGPLYADQGVQLGAGTRGGGGGLSPRGCLVLTARSDRHGHRPD